MVPSLSAVTGISPGRYLWRVSIAFHLGPRLLVVLTYYHFLLGFVSRLKSKEAAERLTSLLNYCFYLQIAEIAGLCLISFVHNREHYREANDIASQINRLYFLANQIRALYQS